MDNYIPPFDITNIMLERVSSIMKKIGKLDNYKDLNKMPILRRNNRIKSIHSSLAIEANSLSLDEVKDIIDGKLLISYPIASEREEYTVLDTTEEIQAHSISAAENLKKLYIKEGIKKLNEGSLYFCKNLEELHLPKGLQEIDKYAIENNTNLKLIKYASTIKDWDYI